MIMAPWNADARLGEPAIWHDDNWRRIPDSVLVTEGIRIDNRGMYWSKADYRKVFIINKLDIKIPEGFTAISPVDSQPSIWDSESGEWILDEKEIARRASILSLEEVREFVSGLVHEGEEAYARFV